MKKRLGIIILCTAMLLGGCTGYNPAALYDNNRRIAGQGNTYNKVNYKQSQKDNTYKISCEVFEGMDTLWSYNASEDMEMKMTYSLEVEGGKAKLVLISPDGELQTITEIICDEDGYESSGSSRSSATGEADESNEGEAAEVTLQLKEGNNRIKLIGGADTSLNLEMTFTEK